ncbi:PP2C family protein-serine/threonine phosphatase [Microbacterium sp. SSW1-59]|uniref:PP2C family protein-serine/threonine phosphatase n=1 Tax=Microbacterium xanthum TaxID=3079794 RepID=UPI002AD4D279|nr:PP2C family protein-serine/threonine phosphatase [Microbacterium sp. SSW1-59]MDZ8200410.1 PP2C family protein-serine/threonine phosphatase [Microbacterium sp. SSW1-59]
MTPDEQSRQVSRWLRAPADASPDAEIDLGPLADFADLASADPALLKSIETASKAYRRQFAQIRALSEAQVQSQERLAAIGELTDLVVAVLDTPTTIDDMLETARTLTDSDMTLLATAPGVLDGAVRFRGGAGQLDDAAWQRVRGRAHGQDDGELAVHEGSRVVTTALSTRGAGATRLGAMGFARVAGEPYSTADLQLIDTVSAMLELGLTLHVIHAASVRRAALEHEHRIASQIAQATLATPPATVPGLDTVARSVPAHVSGGDFHVAVAAKEVLWFAAGDVSGKGLPAAIVMSRIVSTLRAAFAGGSVDDLSAVWTRLEDDLFDYLEQLGMFATIAFGYASTADRTVVVCNAGHSPVIEVGAQASAVPATAPPLGVLRGRAPEPQRIDLAGGSALVLASDGLAEQEDPSGELFGYDRFGAMCVELADLPAQTMVERMLTRVEEFTAGAARSDDQTVFVIRAETVDERG